MKLSKAKSKILRCDVNKVNPTDDLSVDIKHVVDVNDYLNPGCLTVVIKWKINAIDKITKDEIIGYLNESTAVISDLSFDQDDLLLLKTFVESSFLASERLFQGAFVYQNKLPVPEYYPIAQELWQAISNRQL